MIFEKIVETIIKEAMERGEFNNLSNRGRPIDLSSYFDTPEEIRAAYSILKNAGILPHEAELLKEIAELKLALTAAHDEQERGKIKLEIEQKRVEFSLMMDHIYRK